MYFKHTKKITMILLIILTLILNFLSLISSDAKSDNYFSIKMQISNIINIYKVNVLLIESNVFLYHSTVHDINSFSIHQLQINLSHSINLGRF